jgi:hypothetical protein
MSPNLLQLSSAQRARDGALLYFEGELRGPLCVLHVHPRLLDNGLCVRCIRVGDGLHVNLERVKRVVDRRVLGVARLPGAGAAELRGNLGLLLAVTPKLLRGRTLRRLYSFIP